MANIGTYHIADNPSLYEPARSNNFEFVAHLPTKLLRVDADEDSEDENDYIKNAQEVLRISTDASSVPNYELSEIEISKGNNKVYFAGTPSYNTQTIKCIDYMGAETYNILLALKEQVYNSKTEKINLASKYKFDAQLIEYTPDHLTILRIWDIKGCWVKSLEAPEFASTSNDKREISVTIRYDKAFPHRNIIEEA